MDKLRQVEFERKTTEKIQKQAVAELIEEAIAEPTCTLTQISVNEELVCEDLETKIAREEIQTCDEKRISLIQ